MDDKNEYQLSTFSSTMTDVGCIAVVLLGIACFVLYFLDTFGW